VNEAKGSTYSCLLVLLEGKGSGSNGDRLRGEMRSRSRHDPGEEQGVQWELRVRGRQL